MHRFVRERDIQLFMENRPLPHELIDQTLPLGQPEVAMKDEWLAWESRFRGKKAAPWQPSMASRWQYAQQDDPDSGCFADLPTPHHVDPTSAAFGAGVAEFARIPIRKVELTEDGL